jgi:hypothetical protein
MKCMNCPQCAARGDGKRCGYRVLDAEAVADELAHCTHPYAKPETPWCQRCGAWRSPVDGAWQRSDLGLRAIELEPQ